MDNRYSSQAFFDFLYALPSLRLLKDATARNLKNSALLLLSAVDLNSEDDIREFDVEQLIDRYIENQNPKPTESSIQNYRSRFKSAVKKFDEYVSVGTVLDRSEDDNEFAGLDAVEEKIEKSKPVPDEKVKTFNLPVLLRPETGALITIQNLPTNFTEEEAERILSILKAYIR
ncbi:hypothetical protein ACU6YH_16205 [Klebsiella aerogenes]|nr:hypothetical protein [Klebsiella aerogenes]